MALYLLGAIALSLCVYWLTKAYVARRTRLPFPPGPPGEPILGHMRKIPTDKPLEYTYWNWSKEYDSDVIYVNIAGQPVVVLNSVPAAVELLDKRGMNYCDRPGFTLLEILGWTPTLTFLRWGAQFKLHRRILQRAFTSANCVDYQSIQEKEARTLLAGLLHEPEKWETKLRRFSTAVVMSIGFGVDIESDNDQYIKIAEDVSYALANVGPPAGSPVDFFPPLKYFPNWLVDRSLKFARDWNPVIRRMHDVPFEAALKAQDTDIANPSFTHTLLRQQKSGKDEHVNAFTMDDIKGAAGAVFVAGQDTTQSTLLVLMLNLVLHPEVQQKAQEQIDAVVGTGRLPGYDDRAKLPYIDYIMEETLRWGPVSPLGLPHRSLKDDEYEGTFIPAGSWVFANARAMTHDDRLHANPDSFDPDRYAPVSEGGRGEPYPLGQFGFGRRICVGKYLAEASIWIVVASLLATMKIEKAVDHHGQPIVPDTELTSGLTSHPKPFQCVIKPRSEGAKQLIEEFGS